MNLFIQRLTKNREIPTFGVLLQENQIPFALTLERPWKDNQRSISCIPTGAYICKRIISPKFGNTFQVIDVPNRDMIEFHKGTFEKDTHGCIIIGEQFGSLLNQPVVFASQAGFEEFLRITTTVSEFELFIRDPK